MKYLSVFTIVLSLSGPSLAEQLYDANYGTFPSDELQREEAAPSDTLPEQTEYSDWSDENMMQNERQEQQQQPSYEEFEAQDEVDSYNQSIDEYPMEEE